MAIHRKKTKNGEPRYLVRVRDSCGQLYPAKTFRKKTEAQSYERHLKSKREEGGVVPSEELRKMKVSDYWEQWSFESRPNVSEGWRKSQNQMARDYLLPVIGSRRLTDVRPYQIGKVLYHASKNGLGPSTLRHVYNLLHKMFEDAVEHYEYLPRNPVLKRYRPSVPRRERLFLTPAESWTLLEESKSHFLGPAIWLGLLSGLRPSEIQALRFQDVDFERMRISIQQAYKRKVRRIEPYPKQKDWGSAPMPEDLAKYLRVLRGQKPLDAYVAPGLKGGMLKYEILLYGLKRLCRKAGVKVISPHELRHSCTELYIEAGASAEDIRRLLNQSSLSVTQTYIHRTDERLSQIAGKVGAKTPHPTLQLVQ